MDIQEKVAIYARVSTEEQAEHGYSIDAQKEVLAQYCRLYGKKIVGEYVDAGVSGKEMTKRRALQRLLSDAEEGKFSEVIVWKINRMSRNTKDLLEIVDRLTKYNINFTSLSEKFDTSTPMGRFALQLMGSVGELERNTIVENVKLGMKQRARMGLHNGGRALGYTVAPTKDIMRAGKNDLIIVPEEAEIIRIIFSMFLAGNGFRSIANKLNHLGYKTCKGNSFGMCAIREIIDNPIYKGYIRYARYENWSEKRRRGKNDNPIIVKGKFEPIIPEEEWDEAAKLRKVKKKVTDKVFSSDNFLSNIIRCPECGAPMVISRSYTKLKSGQTRAYRFYSCSEFKNKGSTVCHSNSVSADMAESYVIERIKEVLAKPEILQKLLDKVNAKTADSFRDKERKLKLIDRELEELNNRKRKILDLYVCEDLDQEVLKERIDNLTKEGDKLAENRAALIAQSDVPVGKLNGEYLKGLLRHLNEVMEIAPREQRYLFLRKFISKITLKDHKVDKIHLKFGEDLQNYMEKEMSPTGKVGDLFLSVERKGGKNFLLAV